MRGECKGLVGGWMVLLEGDLCVGEGGGEGGCFVCSVRVVGGGRGYWVLCCGWRGGGRFWLCFGVLGISFVTLWPWGRFRAGWGF